MATLISVVVVCVVAIALGFGNPFGSLLVLALATLSIIGGRICGRDRTGWRDLLLQSLHVALTVYGVLIVTSTAVALAAFFLTPNSDGSSKGLTLFFTLILPLLELTLVVPFTLLAVLGSFSRRNVSSQKRCGQ
jgi:hypothetical protein